MHKERRRFIAYYRVSTNGQSPESQLASVREYAYRSNIDIVCEFKEIETASGKRDRVVFDHALKTMDTLNAEGMIVYDVDRYFRSCSAGLECFEQAFKRTNKTLVSVCQQFDTSSDDGWFNFALYLLLAERELRTINRRTMRGKQYLKGHDVHLNGPASFGKRLKTVEVNGVKRSKLEEDPTESHWIKEARKLREEYGYTYEEIATVFNIHWQVPGKSGCKRKWDKGSIYRLLAGGMLS